MSLFKSFLAGTTALVAMSVSAYAADMDALPPVPALVAREPGPVDPVPPPPVCKKGFYQMPSTETCMKVGGLIRAYTFFQPNNGDIDATKGWIGDPTALAFGDAHNDLFSIGSVGRLSVDAVTKTSLGDLRGRVEIGGNTGAMTTYEGPFPGQSGNNIYLRYAFVEVAGWTIGHTQSFFNGGDGGLGGFAGPAGDYDPGRKPLIGYTAELSKEFKASVSIENHDNVDGRDGEPDKNAGMYASIPAPPLSAIHNDSSYLPDLVGSVTGEFDWGSFAVSGAVGQYRFFDTVGTYADDFIGWAVGAGTTIKLDGITKGDAWQAKFGYADGAVSYLGTSNDGAIIDNIGPDFGYATTTGWTAESSFLHNWSATWNSTLNTGYQAAQRTSNADTAGWDSDKIETAWNVGGNLTWQPHENFNIGGDVYYAAASKVDGSEDDAFGGLMRMQRSF